MSTGTKIIEGALQKIGAHSVISPANPESIELGRVTLNSMCETWLTRGIKIGFTPLRVPGDDLNEPADTRNAIINKLAIELAPDFDNGRQIVSTDLLKNAKAGFAQIRRAYQSLTIPEKGVSSTLPVGQGNRRRRPSRVFFGKDATIDG